MTAPARLTRAGWLDLALRRLTETGPEALRLDAICAAAGRTKGSFYHHFSDHDAFLLDVTREWIARQTDAVETRFPAATVTEADLLELVRMVLEMDLGLEAAIRHLARGHDGVAALVRETDARRVALSAEVYARRFGLGPAEAREMALIDYATFMGLAVVAPDMGRAEHLRLYERFEDLVRARFGPSRLGETG